ncbi:MULTISPECIES: 5-formyltetrahydrofolate cyclo-ligase [unclassified Leeuwenhoekiella]|uniref:5-formyltetrahydrofolate cyclo-ligase n=1 Tax=unclassified Leeuwenhoekiella TaxID=2615029 RepID=UPI000C4D26DF|nr:MULTISPECIES: 5-formyltetrahydrofolate cyclo-ligase [unclassified Leeuwenhoekiella]MAW95816.1 5-formyltetrahydrofolate cyclo-ligase [Leeuwenhoekiella sp.]MBA82913.1 5-formyltetrahydrofolate cyclo-ligase [Leeuwenhoekiella sp.]|tara:strand:+ start:38192 stop:38755 length:564 start_codon:yes stop_codon:yes gene_type:complete
MTSKAEYRKKYKDLRKQLTSEEREEASLQIANQLLSLDIWQHEFYHIFLPIIKLGEINTEYTLNILSGKDKNVVLSKSNFEQLSMTHYLLTDNLVIKPNAWGIPEPQNGLEIKAQQLDVIFIPLLACDLNGNRLGYGKGFYDRFLANCKPGALKIGLNYFEPEISLPHNTEDIPLTHCITPQNTYCF